MTLQIQQDQCGKCFGRLITDTLAGEKICSSCGLVIESRLEDQQYPSSSDDDGNSTSQYSITSAVSLSKKELKQLGLERLSSIHSREDTLMNDIKKMRKTVERHLSYQDHAKKQAVMTMVEKLMIHEYEIINEIAESASKYLPKTEAHKPISVRMAKQQDIIKQTFDYFKIGYMMRTKKRKKVVEGMTSFEKQYWIEQNRDKRGRKPGLKIGQTEKWEFYGLCKKCNNEKGKNIAEHQRKYHPDVTEQAVRNWFSRRICTKTKESITQCPICGQSGRLYKRKRGTYFFNHSDGSKQHTIPLRLAEVQLEETRRNIRKNKKQSSGILAI